MTEFERSHDHPVGIGKVIKPADLHFDHIVHEMDIRRPLGLPSQWDTDDMRAALEAAARAKTPLLAPAKIAKGLHPKSPPTSIGPTDRPTRRRSTARPRACCWHCADARRGYRTCRAKGAPS